MNDVLFDWVNLKYIYTPDPRWTMKKKLWDQQNFEKRVFISLVQYDECENKQKKYDR